MVQLRVDYSSPGARHAARYYSQKAFHWGHPVSLAAAAASAAASAAVASTAASAAVASTAPALAICLSLQPGSVAACLKGVLQLRRGGPLPFVPNLLCPFVLAIPRYLGCSDTQGGCRHSLDSANTIMPSLTARRCELAVAKQFAIGSFSDLCASEGLLPVRACC